MAVLGEGELGRSTENATEEGAKKRRKNGVPTKYEREGALFLKTLHEPISLSLQPPSSSPAHLSTSTWASRVFLLRPLEQLRECHTKRYYIPLT